MFLERSVTKGTLERKSVVHRLIRSIVFAFAGHSNQCLIKIFKQTLLNAYNVMLGNDSSSFSHVLFLNSLVTGSQQQSGQRSLAPALFSPLTYDPWNNWRICRGFTRDEINRYIRAEWCEGHSYADFLTWEDEKEKIIPIVFGKSIGVRELSPHVEEVILNVENEALRFLFWVVVSVCGVMKYWNPGDALRYRWFDISNKYGSWAHIVPLEWYENGYNFVKNYCRCGARDFPFYVIRGSAGIGKSTFVSYLICRWLNNDKWYSALDREINTILLKLWKKGRYDGWGGFRKMENGDVLFFELSVARGSNPISEGRGSSFVIRFNEDGSQHLTSFSEDISFDKMATLCIFDSLQEKAKTDVPMILGIMSAGGGRSAQIVERSAEILVPCPTNEEMGRICYLQEDRNVGRQFQRLFKLVGNNLRQCFRVLSACDDVIEGHIGKLENLNILDPDYVIAHIFDDNCYLHSLIKIVPVSVDDSGDFDSFRRFQVDYWSDKLLWVAQKHNLLLAWVRYENRLVTGILLELLVHQISRKCSISGVKGTVIVTVNDKNEIKAERSMECTRGID
jgi:hypothetical protein